MNKTAVRNFAVAARRMLTQAVTQQAYVCGITDGSSVLPSGATEAHRALLRHIGQHGFAQTMEEAAYIWFNRFISLRFMEVNGYLPSRVRVFSDADGAFRPELLAEAVNLTLDGLDHAHVLSLIEAQENDALYRYLILVQCRSLSGCLPEVFGADEWAEVLCPSQLLRSDSVTAHMVTDIPEEDWRSQVQIIGWLYQYYNSEPKARVFAALRQGAKIGTEDIPAATQLFTPDWLVRYLVENSLGRLWAQGHARPAGWDYYLEEAEQSPAVQEALDRHAASCKGLHPEDIRFLDPCMGSGHILVYAFDVLMQLYTACGWTEREAAASILQNNLFGLDIDRRAYQLASFALMMKARQYDRRILRSGIRPQLAHFSDLPEGYGEAAAAGSLLCSPDRAPEPIARILSQTYDAVCTNPPYMGSAGMNAALAAYVKAHYPDSKSDLFACFMEQCSALTKPGGYYAMLTMQSWMFLMRFAGLRRKMAAEDVVSLLHLGAGAFPQNEVGTIVQTAAFVIRKTDLPDYRGRYLDLCAPASPGQKRLAFLGAHREYRMQKTAFRQLPTAPLAYQASPQTLALFAGTTLGDVAEPRQGMTTSDNARFIRRWYEADVTRICFTARSCKEAQESQKKWFPYSKGGGYRKWYGNHEYIVNFEDNGRELRAFHAGLNKTSAGGRIKNQDYYFRRCIAWTFIAKKPGFRCCPDGFIFDVAGSSLFTEDSLQGYVTAYLCSCAAVYFLHLLNPSMNIQTKDIRALPFVQAHTQEVEALAAENIALCREDWDAFETSYGFKEHPLL